MNEELDKLLEAVNELQPIEEGEKDKETPKTPAVDLMDQLDYMSSNNPQAMEDPYGIGSLNSLFHTAQDRVGDELAVGASPYEIAARGQSTADKWANGFTKALANVGTTVVGGTLGTIYGLAAGTSKAFKEKELSAFAQGFINNGFNESLDTFTESMQEWMPNLKTRQEQELGLAAQLGTPNFWADDFANGLSFTAGAILTELIYSGITAGSLGALSGVQALGTARLFKQGANMFSKATKAMGRSRVANNALGLIRQTATGAGYEAAFEARHTYNDLIDIALEEEGVNSKTDISPERMEQIERASNLVFAGNLALVSTSNMIAFSKIFKTPKIDAINKAIKSSKIDASDLKNLKLAKKSKLEKAALVGYTFSKGPISEGFIEEGGQNLMGRMATDYLNRKIDDRTADEPYALWEGLGRVYTEAKGDKDFWKEVMIGAMIGSMGNAIASPKTALKDNAFTKAANILRDKNPELQNMIDRSNKNNNLLRYSIDNLTRQKSYEIDKAVAIGETDKKTQKDIEDAELYSYIFPRYQLGLDNVFEEEIEQIANMELAKYKEHLNEKDASLSDKEIEERRSEVVASMKSKIEGFRESMRDAETFFGSSADPDVFEGAGYLFFGQRRAEERLAQMKEEMPEALEINPEILDKITSGVSTKALRKRHKDLYKKIRKIKNAKEAEKDEELLEIEKEILSSVELDIAFSNYQREKETKEDFLDSLIEQIKLREDIFSHPKVSSTDKLKAEELLDDMIYVNSKSKLMKKFLDGFFKSPARKNFEEIIQGNKDALAEYLPSAIEEAAYDKYVKQSLGQPEATSNPVDYNLSTLANLGNLLRSQKLAEDSPATISEDVDPQVADTESEEVQREDPNTLTREEELATAKDNTTFQKTPFEGVKTWFRINTVWDEVFDKDGNIRDNVDKAKLNFYRALYSLHFLKNNQPERSMIVANGETDLDYSKLNWKTRVVNKEDIAVDLYYGNVPANIDGEQVTSWLPKASFVNPGNEFNPEKTLKFSFDNFFKTENVAQPVGYDKVAGFEAEGFQESVDNANETDAFYFKLKEIQEEYKALREDIINGKQKTFSMAKNAFNRGVYPGQSSKTVEELFPNTNWREAIEKGHLSLVVAEGNSKKRRNVVIDTEAVIGGSIVARKSGMAFLIKNGSTSILNGLPVGEQGNNAIRNITAATVQAVNAIREDDQLATKIFISEEKQDNPNNVLNNLRQIANFGMFKREAFDNIDGKAILNDKQKAHIVATDKVFISNVYGLKDGKLQYGGKFQSAYKYHFKDAKGNYAEASFPQAMNRPEIIDFITSKLYYNIRVQNSKEGFNNTISLITKFNKEADEIERKEIDLAEWMFDPADPKVKIYSSWKPYDPEADLDTQVSEGNKSMSMNLQLEEEIGYTGATVTTDKVEPEFDIPDPEMFTPIDEVTAEASETSEDSEEGFDFDAFLESTDDPDFQFRIAKRKTKRFDKAEYYWFKSTFSNIDISTKNLGLGIQGMTTKAGVIIDPTANEGTIYHEAFHVFYRNVKNTISVNNVRKALKKTIIRTQDGTSIVNIPANEATDLQIEEWLAEEFVSYMNSPEDYNAPFPKVEGVFAKIWEAIKRLLGISPDANYVLDFKKLKESSFSNVVPQKLENIPNNLYRLEDKQLFQASVLFYNQYNNYLRAIEEVPGESYFNLNKYISKDRLFGLKEFLKSQEERYEDKNKKRLMNMLHENFDTLMPLHIEFLSNMGVDAYENLEERMVTKDNIDYEDKAATSSVSRADKPLTLYLNNVLPMKKITKGKMVLANLLHDSRSIDEMVSKMVKALKNPAYVTYHREIATIARDLSDPKSDYMFSLRTKFYTTFSQSKTDIMSILVAPTTSLLNSTFKQSSLSFLSKWKEKASSLGDNGTLTNKEGIVHIKPKVADLDVPKTSDGLKKFYGNLGLELSNDDIGLAYDELKNMANWIINKIAADLAAERPSTLDSMFFDEGSGSSQLAGDSKSLMEKLLLNRIEDQELSSFNAEGKKQHAISLTTHLHRVTAAIARGTYNIGEHTGIYEAMKKAKRTVGKVTGLTASSGESSAFHNMEESAQLMVTLESMMQGKFLMPADDRNTPYTLDVGNSAVYTTADYATAMRKSLLAEMRAYYDYKNRPTNQLRTARQEKNYATGLYVFNDMDKKLELSKALESKTPEEVLKSHRGKINNYFSKQLSGLKKNLEAEMVESGIILKDDKRKYFLINSRSVAKALGNAPNKLKVASEGDIAAYFNKANGNFEVNFNNTKGNEYVDTLMTYLAGTYSVMALESSKIFAGGLARYKGVQDFFKRNARVTSPQYNNDVSKKTLEHFNQKYPRVDNRTNRDTFRVITVDDPSLPGIKNIKNKMDIIDAFSYMNPEAYRDLRLMGGYRWEESDEILHQYNMQSFFLDMMKTSALETVSRSGKNFDKRFANVFNQKNFDRLFGDHFSDNPRNRPHYKGEAIDPSSLKASIIIEKPHGIGPSTYQDGTVIPNHTMKTAIMPLYYEEIKNSEDFTGILIDMMVSKIDLLQTPTSNKGDYPVTPDGTPIKAFDSSSGSYQYNGALGEVNNGRYIGEFPAEYLSIQQDPSKDSDTVTFSVQLMSLVKSGLINRLEGSEKERMENLNKLSEKALAKIRDKRYKNLLTRLGVNDKGFIPKKNWIKVKNFLVDSQDNQYTPKATKDAIAALLDPKSTIFTGNTLNLDYSVQGEKLSTMFTSIFNSQVMNIKKTGKHLVQVPALFFDNDLKFYEQGDKTTKAEVMIAFPKELSKWLEDNFNNDLSALNEVIHKKEYAWLTEIVANRVPTSGLNLIESFKVKKFLPTWSGKKIVLPNGITEKAGSDFDIDKLTTYFNSYEYVDGKIINLSIKDIDGKPSQEEAENLYAITKNLVTKMSKKSIRYQDLQDALTDPLIANTLSKNAENKSFKKALRAVQRLPEYKGEVPEESIDVVNNFFKSFNLPGESSMIRAIMEETYGTYFPERYILNGVQEIYDEFIRHPENYEQLTEPLVMDKIQEPIQKKIDADNAGETYINNFKESNLRAFDIVENIKRKYRFVRATSDLGVTAKALAVEGILSSSGKEINSIIQNPFSKGTLKFGNLNLKDGDTVIEVLNQVAQAQLEAGKNPAIGYANILGESNIIFQALVRTVPQLSVKDLVTFFSSEEVVDIIQEAQRRSSIPAKMKAPNKMPNVRNNSFSAALGKMAEGKNLRADMNKEPDFEVSKFSIEDLLNENWRKANKGAISGLLNYFYTTGVSMGQVGKLIYQDADNFSGASELNNEMLDKLSFFTQKKPLFNSLDVIEAIEDNRTATIMSSLDEYNTVNQNMKLKSAHGSIRKRFDEIMLGLPNTMKKSYAMNKLENYFITYILQNEHQGLNYEEILTNDFVEEVNRRKNADPTHPLYSRLLPTIQRILPKEKRRSTGNTIKAAAKTNDMNELNYIHNYGMRDKEFLKKLAYLAVSNEGTRTAFDGILDFIPATFMMETFAGDLTSWREKASKFSKKEAIDFMNTFETILFSNYKIATDRIMIPEASNIGKGGVRVRSSFGNVELSPTHKIKNIELVPLGERSKASYFTLNELMPDNTEVFKVLKRMSYQDFEDVVPAQHLPFFQETVEGHVIEKDTKKAVYMVLPLKGDADLLALKQNRPDTGLTELERNRSPLAEARKEAQERAGIRAATNVNWDEVIKDFSAPSDPDINTSSPPNMDPDAGSSVVPAGHAITIQGDKVIVYNTATMEHTGRIENGVYIKKDCA